MAGRKPKIKSVAARRSPPPDRDSDTENDDPEITLVDGILPDGSNVLGPRQDPRIRRDIRQQYARIRDELQANREDFIRPGCDGLYTKLTDTDGQFKRVQEPREAAMDSGIVALISQLAKQQVQAIHTDFCVFDPVEFAQKLITLIGGNQLPDTERDRIRISRDGWIKLGEAAQPFFKRSPPLHCMFGTFEREPPKKKAKVPRAKEKKDESTSKAPTEPKQLKSFKDVEGKQEVTTLEVERMFSELQRFYRDHGEKPICFFTFIVNPISFGLTIENLFYASFLIRDGLARMTLDEDKLPVIEPIERIEDEDVGRLPRHQVVMTITQAEWKEIVKTFQIREAMIQPRPPT